MKTIIIRLFSLLKLSFLVLLAGLVSCEESNRSPVGYWNVTLSTKYENPVIENRMENGTLRLTLWDDNTLDYVIGINNLNTDDKLISAQFHVGDVISNGNAIFDFKPVFSGDYASGSIIIRQTLADSLRTPNNQIYFNICSEQAPDGLVRGQMNTDIVLTSFFKLTGSKEEAIIRTTTENTNSNQRKIYFNIMINDLKPGDQPLSANIHLRNDGDIGDPHIQLCTSSDDFGINNVALIDENVMYDFYTKNPYLNIITAFHPDGVIQVPIVNEYTNPRVNINN